ncbi:MULTISPECIES: substrate-binding domain-containing protein [unclassified Nostoc]|uniref:substrate-binding domain-containing protein n=1 Tax=unclassified Nostoc TaxID=2593658 RepID=UPI002AD1D9BD|nr:substrate-binding domain-containing protein [Nostoc sp. DedQUE03]MDZ7973786.1 substrate-binding domain-containing protein [Nostoc sp. DedQUE03]MDZ8048572.1 substrate-binding domain-containing protein [Nostoc sp. DedQUE02]
MAIVNLKLRRTSDEGFLVILRAKNLDEETEGFLPPLLPELESSFNKWQSAYRQIEAVRSCVAPAPGLRLTPKSITIHSHAEHTGAVKDYLNQWLNSGDSKWQPIRDRLIAIAQQLHQSNDEIRVIIDAKDIDLRRLPWQAWNLFEEHYPNAEVALSAPKSFNPKINKLVPKSTKVRILVAVGRSNGINTKDDLKVIQDLETDGVEVRCLIKPSRRDLCEALWDEQGYHIFVFTGHSGSQEDGQIGWIELNDEESLTIEEFKEALKQAIDKGLQLAIFNSCDGLGLANQLAQLHLPQVIVMREPVPDPVAVDFLRYFFKEFTHNNKSLFTSVKKARKRLEHFKSDYPGAIWLPTICIEANVEPLTWQGLRESSPPKLTPIKLEDSTHQPKKNIKSWLLIGLLAVVVSSGAAYLIRKKVNSDFSSVTAPEGTWLYGGSTSWAPIRQYVDPEIKKAHPQFELRYTDAINATPGSGTGIRMLLSGQLTFSQSSRPIADREYQQSQQRGLSLKQIPVALEGLAIAVHPDLQIPGLTLRQIKDIYTGKITNWNQVGGPNLKITAYSRRFEDGGTVEFLVDNILGKEKLGSNVVYVQDTTEALRKLASDRSGIYYASAPEVVPQCHIKALPIAKQGNNFVPPYTEPLIKAEQCPNHRNKLNINAFKTGEYPITRQMFVIVKQNGGLEQQAGEAYANMLLTSQGQKLMNEAGFVRIR